MLLCAACAGQPPSPPPAPRPSLPDVVLIVADTLRADALGAYGALPGTPHLDRLSRRGLLLADVRAAAPWTLPSLASAFSGLPPHATGVTGQLDTVAASTPLVAEELAARGYHTAAISANFIYVAPWSGLARGFELFEVLAVEPGGKVRVGSGITPIEAIGSPLRPVSGSHVLGRGWRALATMAAPRFLYLHAMDTHFPYPSELPRLEPPPGAAATNRLAAIDLGAMTPTPADARACRNLYEEGVRSFDHALGKLLRHLPRRPMRLVVTSDHGEELLEHGGLFHGHTLHDELLRVPALVVGAGSGIDDRPRSLTGLRELLLEGAWPDEPEPYAERFIAGYERSVVRGPRKLIDGERGPCVHDLGADPAELWDAGSWDPELVAPLQQAIASRQGAIPQVPRLPVSDETLRSLGYVR